MSLRNNKIILEISKLFLITSDVLAIIIPAYIIYTFSDWHEGSESYRIKTFLGVGIFAFSMLFSIQTLYEQYTVRRSFYDEFKDLLNIYLFNGLTALSALFIFDLSSERDKHVYFLMCVFFLIPIFRFISRLMLDYVGLWRIECLLLCPQSEFSNAKAAIESQFNLGMTIRRSSLENRLLIKLINNIERDKKVDYDDIQEKIHQFHQSIGFPHIMVFSNRKNASHIPRIIELITLCGLKYSIIPDIGGASLLGMRVSHFFRWELLLITPQNNLQRISYRIIKRTVDVILSIFFIIILSPIMILLYFLIKRDGGPAIFKHSRIGQKKEIFDCLKFRSMRIDSGKFLEQFLENNASAKLEWIENHKLNNDPRVTALGKFLRRSSLDELPQLFNVLMGNMSLVGPRPIVKDEIEKYGKNIEMYYKVRPGITGLWQISGRSNTSYEYRVSLDIWYIKNWSIWYDIGILFKTVSVVLSRRGAH